MQQRYDWIHKWQQTDLDFTTSYIFFDESALHINLNRSMTWLKKGTPPVVTMPTIKANTISILDVINAIGLTDISLRVPSVSKRESLDKRLMVIAQEQWQGIIWAFLNATLDKMDKYSEIKGHYLVINNAPIHSSTDIEKYIHRRWYRRVYLSLYYPELNLIERF